VVPVHNAASRRAQMDRILKEERNYILQMVKKIRASGANVLLIQKSILRDAVTDLSLHYLVRPDPVVSPKLAVAVVALSTSASDDNCTCHRLALRRHQERHSSVGVVKARLLSRSMGLKSWPRSAEY